jgi:hypothetical protein
MTAANRENRPNSGDHTPPPPGVCAILANSDANPKGIESFSPGLRASRYPGSVIQLIINSERVEVHFIVISQARSCVVYGQIASGRPGGADLNAGLSFPPLRQVREQND